MAVHDVAKKHLVGGVNEFNVQDVMCYVDYQILFRHACFGDCALEFLGGLRLPFFSRWELRCFCVVDYVNLVLIHQILCGLTLGMETRVSNQINTQRLLATCWFGGRARGFGALKPSLLFSAVKLQSVQKRMCGGVIRLALFLVMSGHTEAINCRRILGITFWAAVYENYHKDDVTSTF